MIMIDPKSGKIALGSGFELRSGLSEHTFLGTSYGSGARVGLQNADYHWYHLDVLSDDEAWVASLCFKSAELESVSMSPLAAGATWNTFSADHENLKSDELRKRVQQWFGVPPSNQISQSDRYSFAWGNVTVGLVPQDATVSLSVRYAADASTSS